MTAALTMFGVTGWSGSKSYRAWLDARSRCSNPRNQRWPIYGGRGICMCEDFQASFLAFLAAVGQCPPDHDLDRIDPDGNYEPGNLRWVPRGGGRRRSDLLISLELPGLSVKGVSVECLADVFDLKPDTLRKRLRRGAGATVLIAPTLKKGANSRV
jgi:hypothetical protein